MKMKSKAQFWRELGRMFELCDPSISAVQLPDGRWELTGGTPDTREQYRRLAAIAGNAMRGKFPPNVKT